MVKILSKFIHRNTQLSDAEITAMGYVKETTYAVGDIIGDPFNNGDIVVYVDSTGKHGYKMSLDFYSSASLISLDQCDNIQFPMEMFNGERKYAPYKFFYRQSIIHISNFFVE